MKRTILIFGAMAGALIFAYTYLTLAIVGDFAQATPKDLEMAQWLGYIRYLLLLLGVAMAMITYRRNTPGPIGYGRSFVVGLLVALVIALFVGAMEYSYVAFTNPHFYEQYAKLMIEGMKQKGASAADLEAFRKEQESYAWMTNPIATGAFYFVETAVIGTIFSLILALFIRRGDNTIIPGEGHPALGGQA
jgi:hypothetical protein